MPPTAPALSWGCEEADTHLCIAWQLILLSQMQREKGRKGRWGGESRKNVGQSSDTGLEESRGKLDSGPKCAPQDTSEFGGKEATQQKQIWKRSAGHIGMKPG